MSGKMGSGGAGELSRDFEQYLRTVYPTHHDQLPPAQRQEVQQAYMAGALGALDMIEAAMKPPGRDAPEKMGALRNEISAYALVRTTLMDVARGKFARKTEGG
jgi:hypothetical protein